MPISPSLSEQIFQHAMRLAAPFASEPGHAWAAIPTGAMTHEACSVASDRFREWLAHSFQIEHGVFPSHHSMRHAVRILQAHARFSDHARQEVFTRIGCTGDPLAPRSIAIDLANPAREVVEITASSWRITNSDGYRFLTRPGARPLPRPSPSAPPPNSTPYSKKSCARSPRNIEGPGATPPQNPTRYLRNPPVPRDNARQSRPETPRDASRFRCVARPRNMRRTMNGINDLYRTHRAPPQLAVAQVSSPVSGVGQTIVFCGLPPALQRRLPVRGSTSADYKRRMDPLTASILRYTLKSEMRYNAVHNVEHELGTESCVVRATHARKGRTMWLEPGRSPMTQLHYGRIILDHSDAPVPFANLNHETGLICLKGAATVSVAGQSFELVPYDSLYIPRDSELEVAPGPEGCDLAEVSAPVDKRYPLRFVPYADIQRDPGLHFKTGAAGTERVINILIGKNVEAGRIVAGVTFSEPGNWTSWPPHEHAEMLEEAYLYIDMPAPSWGVQFVYTNPQSPELMTAVREGDCVMMPKGYHPNVAAPGGSINFLWMMAAHREGVDRQFGVVNVQPEYATGGSSGLEAGRADNNAGRADNGR